MSYTREITVTGKPNFYFWSKKSNLKHTFICCNRKWALDKQSFLFCFLFILFSFLLPISCPVSYSSALWSLRDLWSRNVCCWRPVCTRHGCSHYGTSWPKVQHLARITWHGQGNCDTWTILDQVHCTSREAGILVRHANDWAMFSEYNLDRIKRLYVLGLNLVV